MWNQEKLLSLELATRDLEVCERHGPPRRCCGFAPEHRGKVSVAIRGQRAGHSLFAGGGSSLRFVENAPFAKHSEVKTACGSERRHQAFWAWRGFCLLRSASQSEGHR